MLYTHLDLFHMLPGPPKRNMGLPTASGSNHQGTCIGLEVLAVLAVLAVLEVLEVLWSSKHLDLLWSLDLLWLNLHELWSGFQALVWYCFRHMATTLLYCPHMPFDCWHQNMGLPSLNGSNSQDMCMQRQS